MRFIRHFLLTLAVLASSALVCRAQTSADVIVYGSTPGGYCAAIGAAREGASVILLEPTSHVGGMNTGGLSFSDSDQMYREQLMGLFHEWHLRIQQDYEKRGVTLPYDVNVKNQATWSYEALVAQRVTDAMLAEAGVKVLAQRYLKSVTKSGPRITGIVTSNGTFTGRVFIDGSYEGDLMAAAGVSWRIDRESRAEYGESHAGRQYPKSLMNINGFDDQGNPLPLITAVGTTPISPPSGPTHWLFQGPPAESNFLAARQQLEAPEEEAVLQTLALAAGDIDTNEYAEWLRRSCSAR